MLELLTGCLQEGQSGDRTLGDLVERYKEQPPDSLKDQDIDPVAGNGFDDVIDRLSNLSMKCISSRPKSRPTTATLIDELVSTLAIMKGRESSSDSVLMPGSDVPFQVNVVFAPDPYSLGYFAQVSIVTLSITIVWRSML